MATVKLVPVGGLATALADEDAARTVCAIAQDVWDAGEFWPGVEASK